MWPFELCVLNRCNETLEVAPIRSWCCFWIPKYGIWLFVTTLMRLSKHVWGFPRWLSGKEASCHCRKHVRSRFDPWVQKIPWRRKWQPTLYLPGKFHGQRVLMGYSQRGHERLDTTEWLKQKQKCFMFLQTNREVSKFMPTVRSALPQLNLSNSRKLQTPLFLLSWYFLSLVNLSGVQCFSSVLWIYSLGEMPYLETSTHIAYKYIFLIPWFVWSELADLTKVLLISV